MSQFSTKVCVVGDFAVGKTSTIERFVNNHFSDLYLTTIGVKVDTKELSLRNGMLLKLILWDIAGTNKFDHVEMAYLRGMSGYILVVDGTRAQTISVALDLKRQIESRYGSLPYVLLLNKNDLQQAWEITESQRKSLIDDCPELFVTSAKTGQDVSTAIARLGELIAEREFFDPQ